MSFLLDTDICSAHLKQGRLLTNRFLQYTGRLHVSAITVGELFTWTLRASAPKDRLQSLLELLNDVTVLDVSEQVGRKFGELQAAFYDAGTPAPVMDLFIAATALVYDLTLVSHNVQDFENVPNLRIQDWLQP
jgi:predicted nucleic acid-binding protein